MAAKQILDIVVARLPLYLRALTTMENNGQQYTSSQEIAQALGMSAAQIRKDLSHFGEFGKQGTGYSVKSLQERLRRILKLDREWGLIVIGAGNIGSAVASYSGFEHRGFRVQAVFDSAPEKIGTHIGHFEILDVSTLAEFVRSHAVNLAMIAVPAPYAQSVADQVIVAGITAILNYAPTNLSVPEHVRVENIDPVLHLQYMTYYL